MKLHPDTITVQTRHNLEFVDITSQMASVVDRSGIAGGFILVRSRHTTAAITCNEMDRDVHQDCRELLEDLMPLDREYHHAYEGHVNARAHQAAMLGLGTDTWVPVRSGKLDLGTWQRVFLVELLQPRTRRVDCVVVGE